MKLFKTLYYFLGSVWFAIILIATTALIVIAGTFLESFSDSHRYAALFTYHNPVFIALLWGYFINILVSALRRWPFKMHHVPFLITHWGLLMILGGTLIKSYLGLQGTMGLIEGGITDQVFIPDTQVLRIDRRGFPAQYNEIAYGHPVKAALGLTIECKKCAPNCFEQMHTWIKGDLAYINGLKPFPVYLWNETLEELPISTVIKTLHPDSSPWNVFAAHSSDIAKAARQLYLQGMQISIKDTATQQVLCEKPLKQVLGTPTALPNRLFTAHLNFDYSPLSGFENPALEVISGIPGLPKERIIMRLSGETALVNENSIPHLGQGSYTVDLKRDPALLLLQDLQGDQYLFAFGPDGQVHAQCFRSDLLKEYIVYDKGYGGYGIQTHIPLDVLSGSRIEKEKSDLNQLYKVINEAHTATLVPPLLILHEACQNNDFANTCIDFLRKWDQQGGWLSSVPLTHTLDWEHVSARDLKACYWLHVLFSQIDPQLKQGVNFIELLQQNGWPLIEPLKEIKEPSEQLTTFTQQVFAVADQLPDVEIDFSSKSLQGSMLSAYFRLYGLHLRTMLAGLPKPEQKEGITLETSLTWTHHETVSLLKMEDNIPKIVLELRQGNHQDHASLAYDRFGYGFKVPVLHGEYLLRFQPRFVKIPYNIRLREARQVNYANSSQAYSYEGDLIISDSQSSVEKTISMNNVYETWEGYRFYLSNITPATEQSVKRAQLVVNYDPGKYWLTYPGAIILTCGIFLLFWLRKKER